MYLPQGQLLAPEMALTMVQGAGDVFGVVYRRNDGCQYALGLKDDRLVWLKCGYRYMGSISFLRDRYAGAQRAGVRERSLVWYLLQDVEGEIRRVFGG